MNFFRRFLIGLFGLKKLVTVRCRVRRVGLEYSDTIVFSFTWKFARDIDKLPTQRVSDNVIEAFFSYLSINTLVPVIVSVGGNAAEIKTLLNLDSISELSVLKVTVKDVE